MAALVLVDFALRQKTRELDNVEGGKKGVVE
jgi:hypothetical protein